MRGPQQGMAGDVQCAAAQRRLYHYGAAAESGAYAAADQKPDGSACGLAANSLIVVPFARMVRKNA